MAEPEREEESSDDGRDGPETEGEDNCIVSLVLRDVPRPLERKRVIAESREERALASNSRLYIARTGQERALLQSSEVLHVNLCTVMLNERTPREKDENTWPLPVCASTVVGHRWPWPLPRRRGSPDHETAVGHPAVSAIPESTAPSVDRDSLADDKRCCDQGGVRIMKPEAG